MARKALPTKISAAALGAVLILTLAFLFFLNRFLNPQDQANFFGNGPITSKPISFDLEINNPDDEIVSFDKTILVSGKTASQAVVLISTPSRDTEVDANLLGDFSKEITLDPGLNILYISSFDVQGNSKQIKRTVYYSEEKL